MKKDLKNNSKLKNESLFDQIKERFLNEGISGFSERQLIEIILSYSNPQLNVFPIADRLMKKFHTIKRILDASIEDLLEVDGIAEKAVVLIKLIVGMVQFYNKQNLSEVIRMTGCNTSKKFCEAELKDAVNEEMLIVCLNDNRNIIGTKRFVSNSNNRIDVSVRQITSYVLRNNCKTIIIAHNHPSTPPEPSVEDLSTTSMIISNCILNDINILDHIICSPIGSYSFAEHNVLGNIKLSAFKCLRYTEDSAIYQRFCKEAKSYDNS